MDFNRPIRAAFLTLALLLFGVAQGEVSAWQDIPNGKVRLLSTPAEAGTALGIEFDLQPEWKIYWEYAGPVGQPTLFDGPGVTVLFPWPKRDRLQGFPSYGYEGRVIFPGLQSAEAPGGALRIGVSICSETQCIPHRLSLDLPTQQGESDMLVRQQLAQAFAAVPRPVALQPTLQETADALTLTGFGEALYQDFLVSADMAAARAGFFLNAATPDGSGGLRAPVDIRDGEAALSYLSGARIFAKGSEGAVVFDTRDAAAYTNLGLALGLEGLELTDIPLDTGSDPQWSPAGTPGLSLPMAALLLFIGGLLLNVMPCVLPILFLKMQALTHGADLRGSFGFTALGIVGTFLSLGLILAVARVATGQVLTLGIWLQIPALTVVLVGLLTLFIANAFGWFEFQVPGRVQAMGAGRQDALGHILAGVVAALLGGACAGVLLAVALTVAFSQSVAVMVALLTLMGLGLALPYLLVALIPGAARLIPRPGSWTGWIKPVVGVGLFLTLGYLILITTRQLQAEAVLGLSLVSLIALLILWRGAYRWIALILLASAAVLAPRFPLPPDPVETARNYSAEIASRVAAGERVFVDVTAYWCATCQTNKLLVLDTDPVQEVFDMAQIDLMTINADVLADNISTYLQEVGRNSLPLNILYSPKAPEGEILPSVLTTSAVRQAVDRSL